MEQQRHRTIIQQLETQLNAKQETNQAIPQTGMQPSIPQIPVNISKPPPNVNQTQLSSQLTIYHKTIHPLLALPILILIQIHQQFTLL